MSNNHAMRPKGLEVQRDVIDLGDETENRPLAQKALSTYLLRHAREVSR